MIIFGVKVEKRGTENTTFTHLSKGCCQKLGPEVFLVFSTQRKENRAKGRTDVKVTCPGLVSVLVN